jgi:hypothetical protein
MDDVPRRDPTCPMCERAVMPGNHVVFNHEDFIHLNCHLQADGDVDSVGHFLRRTAPKQHCHTCIARLVQSTPLQVSKAVSRLRMTSGYRVTALAMCAVCRLYRTVRAEPPAAH